MKTASYKLDLLTIELVPPIGQTLRYFVDRLVNPYVSIKEIPGEVSVGMVTYAHPRTHSHRIYSTKRGGVHGHLL